MEENPSLHTNTANFFKKYKQEFVTLKVDRSGAAVLEFRANIEANKVKHTYQMKVCIIGNNHMMIVSVRIAAV